ncbi:MAG: anthranilate synthase component I [Fluviicoccus sp.]|uniref:anthranilate synthase component I n=1 Tax=Fluviicoccus sp. TaxID=2003552 RepID=UPI00271DE7BC|nr:anthranilate synthase component I [Fluviicoccus sp.]MDO8331333.1 anthranilate synthase component I [Fluviicoccus sp.]
MISHEQFAEFARQGYNRIPVALELLADLDTPLSVYLKVANQPYSYLFESVHGGERWGRYSIIGLPSKRRLVVTGHSVRIYQGDILQDDIRTEDPLAFIEEFQQQFKVPVLANLPRFTGGLVGYFGYDCVRYVEKKLAAANKPDPIGMPDIQLMLSEEVIVFDNLKESIYLITHADPTEANAYMQALERLEQLSHRLRTAGAFTSQLTDAPPTRESDFRSSFGEEAFRAGVDHIKEYILAGDVMQVVPSQRLTAPYGHSPMALYRALRHLNPSPYMYFVNCGNAHIVGSSPEILARVQEGRVTVRPIAGTRPRGKTPEHDHALAAELLADPKEIAEHLMLIDLGRNDAGRVSQVGQVTVTEKMAIERYSHVMHIVSNVEGVLKEGVSAIDVLRATLPAGTLSGAPKVRAMEIIDELEPVKRGVYGGAIGYLGWNGEMDTAIAIRTAILKDGLMHVQAGAGVVADSVPEMEWLETMNKARACIRAAELASNHLKIKQ